MSDELNQILTEMKGESTPPAPPQEETPVVETPVVTPGTTETPAAEPVTESQSELTEIKEETPAETSPAATVTKTFEETFKERFGKTPEEFEAATQQQPAQTELSYKSKFGQLFDDLSAKGVPAETILRLGTVETKELKAQDAIDLLLSIDNPEIKPDQRTALITQRYALDAPDGSTEKLAGEAQMGIDAAAARAKIEERKGEAFKPVDMTAQLQQQYAKTQAEKAKAWETTPRLSELAKTETKLTVPLQYSEHGEDGKAVTKKFEYGYKYSAEDTQAIEKYAREVATTMGWDATDEGFKAAIEAGKSRFMLENFNKIVSSVASTLASKLHAEASVKYNNARPPGGQQPIGTENKTKSRMEATLDNL